MGTEATPHEVRALVAATQAIWDSKAASGDERMGEGNQFHRVLVGPASERLLQIRPGEIVLDVACGNGVFSRRLVQLGAHVIALDFSPALLEYARARSTDQRTQIEYILADATDEAQLLSLGEQRFDAAVCHMALQDMPTIDPLLRALRRLLRPLGRFVFAVPHPAFNIPGGSTLGHKEDRSGAGTDVYFIELSRYMHVPPTKAVGSWGEPTARQHT